MECKINIMSREEASEICKWKYEGPYSIYNFEEGEECIDDFINDFINEKDYSVTDKDNNILGYYCLGKSAQVPIGNKFGAYDDKSFTDIGLGMNPNLCGKGLGYEFLKNGIEFGKKELLLSSFRLTVAAFNYRAIKVYKKIGFKEIMRFTREIGSNKTDFIVMVLE